jgi:putative salt-induced outer membrane protein
MFDAVHAVSPLPSSTARVSRAVLAVFAVSTIAGAQTAPTPRAVTVGAAPAEKPATSFTTDFGYVATSGNTNVSTVNIAERVVHSRGYWRFEQILGVIYGEADGAENANLLRAGLGAEYAMRPWVGVATGAAFDRNRFAGIARRTEEYLGLVFRVRHTAQDTLRLETGASLTQQLGVDGVQNNFPAGRAAAWYKRTFGASAFFLQTLEFIPNIDVTDDYRLNSESALVAPLSKRLSLKLGYLVRYDNLPEVGFETTDRIFTSGLQLSF